MKTKHNEFELGLTIVIVVISLFAFLVSQL